MVDFREASEKDIPCILALYRQLSLGPASEVSPPLPEECHGVFEKMHAVPGYRLLVAEEDGFVLGTAVLAILPGMAHGLSPFAVVEYVVVDEKSRRRGVGRQMMEHVMGLAKEAGCYKIMLTSDNRRQEAHRFYESLGFRASAHGFRYYF
jgi:GNAT superfamily N-acetyltransferase